MVDQFFTPFNIASDLLKELVVSKPKIVADFSIGDGNLINALPNNPDLIIGLDLDKKIINRLRYKNPTWKLSTGNFINPSPKTAKWLSQWKRKVDLVILNPPFSFRGGSKIHIDFMGSKIKCRTSLAFIMKSLEYISDNGMLIAILPLSFAKSETDTHVRNIIIENWNIDYGFRFHRNTFSNCFPNSILATFSRRENTSRKMEKNISITNKFVEQHVEIIRGSVRMHETTDNGIYKVIHTTNLQDGCFFRKGLKVSNKPSRLVIGTFLCIPRVGLPKVSKLAIVNLKTPHILSDCVIGLKANNEFDLLKIKELIILHWSCFSKFYESTCAPYITVNQVCEFLNYHGIRTIRVTDFLSERHTKSKHNRKLLFAKP
jgi:predicted RNA methylase